MEIKEKRKKIESVNYLEIGSRIKKMISDNKYTQLQISQELKVSKSTVSKWVNGQAISLDALYILSQFFDCPVDYLISGTIYEKTCNSLDELCIDHEVLTFYQIIKDIKLCDISLTEALNFLIADDVTYQRGSIMNINSRFIEAWAMYLSIDTTKTKKGEMENGIFADGIFQDDYRLTQYNLDLATLENLELLLILESLKEKKERFMRSNKFKNMHKDNMFREKVIAAKWSADYDEETTQESKDLLAKYNDQLEPKNGGKL